MRVHGIIDFFLDQPILLLFLLVALGSVVGHLKVKGISFGAAAVLFVAMGFTALAIGTGTDFHGEQYLHMLDVLEVIGSLGLALFTFCIGVISGPNFFASLRTGLGPILGTAVALVAAAGVSIGVGKLLDLPSTLVAGAFAGSVTNTPALAAAVSAAGDPEINSPTVGYSVTYFFGVLGVLLLAMLALRKRGEDADTPATLTHVTVRVETTSRPTMRDIERAYDGKVTFSHIQRGEENPIEVVRTNKQVLTPDDLVTAVGPIELIQQVARDLGHSSSHNLYADRKFVDLRRITLSNGKLAGRTIAGLELGEKFGAMVTRVRRGDLDMLAHDDLVVQPGDRLRVIMPSGQLKKVSKYLGDSARGLSDINPVALGLGMALGVALGTVTIPIGSGFVLGSAAGTLLIGLLMGRLGRVGPIVTTLPHTAATVLSELGLLVFLAFAGARAGGQIVEFWDPNQIVSLFLVGVASTTTVALLVYLVMRGFFHVGRTKLAGMLGGTQTQPAILAYANEKTAFDSRIAMGYALVYPTSMVVKILLGQLLGGL